MATASLCQEQAKPSPGVVSPRGPCSSLVFKVWSQMATSVAPRSLLKMQTLNSFPRPVGTGNYILTGCPTYPSLWDLCVLNPLLASPGK